MKRILPRIVIILLLIAGISSETLVAVQAANPQAAESAAAPMEAAANMPSQQQLLGATGKITFLRVHDVGTGYGPSSDFLDGEVVIKLNSEPNRSFGFQLRNDNNRPVRQGMMDLLLDAFNNNWTVSVDYWLQQGKSNGTIIRVALTK